MNADPPTEGAFPRKMAVRRLELSWKAERATLLIPGGREQQHRTDEARGQPGHTLRPTLGSSIR